MSWSAFAVSFLALVMLAWSVRELYLSRHGSGRDRAAYRLREMARDRRQRNLAADVEDEEGSILRGDAAPGRRATSGRAGLLGRVELLMIRADLSIGAARFAAISLACGVVLGWISLALWPSYVMAALTGAVAVALPWFWLLWRKRKRTRRFEQQLPEALGLICRALRAGHSLPSGIQMVSQELEAPVALEFGRVADEISLGLETRHALRHLCERVDVPDLAFFSVAVLIQRETGGNLAEIMERLAQVIRQRHLFYGKVRSMTAQNRGAALILLAAPFAFVALMYRANPEFILPLFETHGGNVLAGIAATLTFIGYSLARRLAVVKV